MSLDYAAAGSSAIKKKNIEKNLAEGEERRESFGVLSVETI